ncbi:unnamed protein product [Calypogeia fissa]
MSFSDKSSPKHRARLELKRRCFHKGYLSAWILVFLIPFMLRFVIFYEVTFPFQSSLSIAEAVMPENLQLDEFPESNPAIVEQEMASDQLEAKQGIGEKGQVEKEEPKDIETKKVNDERRAADTDAKRVVKETKASDTRKDAREQRAAKKRTSKQQTRNERRKDAGEQAAENRRTSKKEAKSQDEKVAAEERRVTEEIEVNGEIRAEIMAELEAGEERRDVEKMEATQKGDAEAELKSAKETNAAEGKDAHERRESGEKPADDKRNDKEETNAAQGKEADQQWTAKKGEVEGEKKVEEQRDAGAAKTGEKEQSAEDKRKGEEELPAGKKGAAEEETNAAHGKEADEQWKAEKDTEAEGETKVDERREAVGEKDGEKEKSGEDTKKGNGSRNEEEQNQDAQRSDVEAKNHSEVEEQNTINDPKSDVEEKNPGEAEEHKTTNDPKDDERTVILEQVVEDGKHIGDQNQEKGTEQKQEEKHQDFGKHTGDESQEKVTEQKEEEKHEDSSRKYEGDMTTPIDQTQGASSAGECDLFEGEWVWDPEDPLYTNSTCFYIQRAQNCMSNGRPDTNYLHWKWKPRDCDLPRFNAKGFLEAFKGKTIGFVGDSLSRNQMQSLLCMLSQVEIPKITYQSHDDSGVRWLFEQHQVTLAAVWSPYLLRESEQGIMGFEKGQSVLILDELDTAWTSVMNDFDLIVLSIGQWYFKPSIYVRQEEVVGCTYCPGLNFTHMRYQEAYQVGVRQVLEKVASEFKGIVIMSTFAISHFEEGAWNKGGQCRREKPFDKEEVANFQGYHDDMDDIVMSEFRSIASDKSKLNENVKLEFLDVTKVSLARADGHPGPYRQRNPYEGKDPNEWVANDCLHWCLPGPVDTWNQLLVKIAHRHL